MVCPVPVRGADAPLVLDAASRDRAAVKSCLDPAENPVMNGMARKNRPLSLDKPCSGCGQPIHYAYSGPIKGLCGRCTDKRRRRKRVRAYHRGMTVDRGAPQRRSTAATVVRLTLVMVGCVVAGTAALILLLG